jgi:hypothetical protein
MWTGLSSVVIERLMALVFVIPSFTLLFLMLMPRRCIKKDIYLKKYDNHPWFNSHYDWKTYMTIQQTQELIFTMMLDEIFIQTPKITREVATTWFKICQPSCTKHMSPILREACFVKNRPIYLTSLEAGVGEGSSNKVSGEIFVHTVAP